MTEFPPPRTAKPLWLITLADLALLLVGFLVFVNVTTLDHAALARGVRSGFVTEPPALAVSAGSLDGFAPGSAALPGDFDQVIAFARAAARDPRMRLQIVGGTDGSRGDVDPVTGAAQLLASDRARAVAAALIASGAIAPEHLTLSTNPRGGRRVLVTTAFTGDIK